MVVPAIGCIYRVPMKKLRRDMMRLVLYQRRTGPGAGLAGIYSDIFSITG